MKLERFFEKFDQLADAPNALVSIRRLILDSAVRGTLVEQDPSDEPALSLLERIQEEREHLERKGELRKGIPLAPIDVAPYKLPNGWDWTRLGNTGRIFNGTSVSESEKLVLSKVAEGYPFIATKDVGYGRDRLSYENGLKVPFDASGYKVARAEAVLICAEGGSAGKKVGQTDRDICFGNKLYANEVWPGIDPRYILFLYQTTEFFNQFVAKMTGIIGGIARSEFLQLPVPLPPLAEQKRIVAKVDELLALCDRLEAQQQERDTRYAALARASLARFAEAPTAANLNFLFHNAYAITPADLRKTILTLAVQGKLVPQDSNDELDEKHLDAPKKAERNKPKWAGPIEEQEKPFQLPPSWMWFRLGDISSLKHGYAFSSKFFSSEPAPFVLTTPGNFYEKGGFRDRESKRKYYSGPVDPEFIFKPGDLVIPMTEQAAGLLGSPAFIPDDGRVYIHNQRLGKLSFSEAIAPEFAFWFFNCEFFRRELSRTCTGMKVRHTSPDRILKVPFPVCPLAEQRRIVAKVDQLITLVDQLETQLTASRATAEKLMEAMVAELTASASSSPTSSSVAHRTKFEKRAHAH